MMLLLSRLGLGTLAQVMLDSKELVVKDWRDIKLVFYLMGSRHCQRCHEMPPTRSEPGMSGMKGQGRSTV
jgi:hypothetical protein